MVAGTKINLDNIAECYEEQKRRAEQAQVSCLRLFFRFVFFK